MQIICIVLVYSRFRRLEVSIFFMALFSGYLSCCLLALAALRPKRDNV